MHFTLMDPKQNKWSSSIAKDLQNVKSNQSEQLYSTQDTSKPITSTPSTTITISQPETYVATLSHNRREKMYERNPKCAMRTRRIAVSGPSTKTILSAPTPKKNRNMTARDSLFLISTLHDMKLFSTICDSSHINSIVQYFSLEKFPRNHTIIERENINGKLFIVDRGAVQRINQRMETLQTCTRGDWFGENDILHYTRHDESFVCSEEAWCWTLSSTDFTKLVQRYPTLIKVSTVQPLNMGMTFTHRAKCYIGDDDRVTNNDMEDETAVKL